MENLINELKVQIKEALNLEDLSIEEFDENAPLFGMLHFHSLFI